MFFPELQYENDCTRFPVFRNNAGDKNIGKFMDNLFFVMEILLRMWMKMLFLTGRTGWLCYY